MTGVDCEVGEGVWKYLRQKKCGAGGGVGVTAQVECMQFWEVSSPVTQKNLIFHLHSVFSWKRSIIIFSPPEMINSCVNNSNQTLT